MEKLKSVPIHKEVNEKDHPNFEAEKYFEALENLITLEGNSDDYANLSYLSFNLYRQKFNTYEMNLLNQLKSKYLLYTQEKL